MARHSSGKNNYSLSGNALAVVALLVVLVLLAVWFFFFRGSNSTEQVASQECVSGDLEVPVAAANKEVAQSLIDDWASSQPVVRDYCAKPVVVDSLDQAAVYIGANNAQTTQALADASRTASTSEPTAVITEAFGLAGEPTATADQVNYASAPDAASAAAVATALAPDDAAAEAALSGSGNVQIARADGGTVQAIEGADVTYYAFPLNSTHAVSEDQARAGTALAEFAGQNFTGEPASSTVSDAVLAAASSAVKSAPAQPATSAEASAASPTEAAPSSNTVQDTLYLVDTSAAMQPYSEAAAAAVGESANAVIRAGHKVALWNYSSPLNPGVTQSYRTNIQFTDEPDAVANSVSRLGNAGGSNTRESLQAAVNAVAGTGGNYRIVLITAGSSDVYDDKSFVDLLAPTLSEGVELDVIHVGSAGIDLGIEQLATTQTLVTSNDQFASAVATASGV
ncbi:VWA domain-containing protein [Corynebacterium sp. S7]